MEATRSMTTWGDVIRRYRELAGLSREALSQRVRDMGESNVAAVTIEGYEMKGTRPEEPKARALDAALGTTPYIWRACGYGEPTDFEKNIEAELTKLRDLIQEVRQQIGKLSVAHDQMQTTVELLSREVWPPEEPPDLPPHD